MSPRPTSPIAILTGGSRGLGRSMALHLADRGADLILTYKTGEKEAHEVVRAVADKGRRAVALPLDVGRTGTFDAFVTAVRAALTEQWKRDSFDYLIHNAGHGAHALLAETSEDTFDALMNVHLKGPFFLTQKLAPFLANGGRILNISTGLTRFTSPGYSAYAAMKGALEVLTRYMAKELGDRKISVNTLAPGAIATDFNGGFVRDNPDLNKALASQTALGRVGLPDDIGAAVAALLAPENHWITGQRIEASGGMFL